MSIVPALGRQRQEDCCKFKISLDSSSRPARLYSETLSHKEIERGGREEERGKKEGKRRRWGGEEEVEKEKGGGRDNGENRQESKQAEKTLNWTKGEGSRKLSAPSILGLWIRWPHFPPTLHCLDTCSVSSQGQGKGLTAQGLRQP